MCKLMFESWEWEELLFYDLECRYVRACLLYAIMYDYRRQELKFYENVCCIKP